MKSKILISAFLINLIWAKSFCQTHNDSLNFDYNKRIKSLIIGESALFALTMTGLYSLWYKDYPMSSFHLYDDNREWLQVDKIAHLGASYFIGKMGYESLKWAGVDDKQAIFWGGSTGSIFLLTIEILDGFSDGWGFSLGDFAANSIGSAMFIGQQLLWKEQKAIIKFSTHLTQYQQYRPDVLGNNLPQRIMKDYNGWTFWLSANIYSFCPEFNWIPKWFNIALGYGADGMIGGYYNLVSYKGNKLPNFERYRQYYISLDIDFKKIKTRNKTLKFLFNTLGYLKVPAPTLEFNKNGINTHLLYF